MKNKVCGSLGAGLLFGSGTIGGIFGQYAEIVSIVSLIIGVVLMFYTWMQWEKQQSAVQEEQVNYRAAQLKLLEELSKQEETAHCVKLLDNLIISMTSHYGKVMEVLDKMEDHLLLVKNNSKQAAAEIKKAVQEDIATLLQEIQKTVSQKVDGLGDTVRQYGWKEEDRSSLQKELHSLFKQQELQNDILEAGEKRLQEFRAFYEETGKKRMEKLDKIHLDMEGLSALPKDFREIIAYTFDELEVKFSEYQENNIEIVEECGERLEDTADSVRKRNAELIRKLEDELEGIRESFAATTELFKVEIGELTKQTQAFEKTMNAIMLQLMKMSEEDARILQEVLHGA